MSTPVATSAEFTPRQLELIQILREVYVLLGYQTPTQNFFVNNPKYPGRTVFINAFHGWNNAIRAANLPLNRHAPTYSRRQLVRQITYKCAQLGRAPLPTEVEDDPQMASSSTFTRIFGPWDQVIEAGGYSIHWSTREIREQYFNALWQLYTQLNYREPTIFDIQNSSDPDLPCLVVITNVFGGLSDFLISSGVRADFNQRERTKIVAAFIKRANELGHSPGRNDPYLPDSNQVRRFFSSHNDALEAAGLLPHKLHRTDKRLLQELKDQFRRTGKTPTYKSIDEDPLMASGSTYRLHFGDLETALVKARIPLKIYRKGYDHTVLEQQLKAKILELRRAPTQREVNQDPSMASAATFIRHYGNWQNVCHFAQQYLEAAS